MTIGEPKLVTQLLWIRTIRGQTTQHSIFAIPNIDMAINA